MWIAPSTVIRNRLARLFCVNGWRLRWDKLRKRVQLTINRWDDDSNMWDHRFYWYLSMGHAASWSNNILLFRQADGDVSHPMTQRQFQFTLRIYEGEGDSHDLNTLFEHCNFSGKRFPIRFLNMQSHCSVHPWSDLIIYSILRGGQSDARSAFLR